MRFLPGKCPNCRERKVAEVVERYEVQIEHDGCCYDISLPDLSLLKCEACGNRILRRESDDRVSAALRSAAGLLSPDEIRNSRASLHLSQKDMADLLNIAEARYAQWESGGIVLPRHSDLLLRSLFAVPELRRFLSARQAVSEAAHSRVA